MLVTRPSCPWLSRWPFAVLTFLIGLGSVAATSAQQIPDDQLDIVEFRRDTVSPRQTLAGIVTEMDERSLKIDLGSNGQRSVPRDQILKVGLNSQPAVVQATQLAQHGKFTEAVDAWDKVIKGRHAEWLKHHAGVQKCFCEQAAGQNLAALTTFLQLIGRGSSEPFLAWEAAPLVWGRGRANPILDQQFPTWINQGRPVEKLLAASYGLQLPQHAAAARKAMHELTGAPDRNIAALANAQLWRLETQVSDTRLAEIEKQLQSIPVRLQSGPLLVVGRLKKMANQPRAAVADFLRIATLYPQQHHLVLLGLDQAYLTLNGLEDPQAVLVGRWLKQRFPDSNQAVAIP